VQEHRHFSSAPVCPNRFGTHVASELLNIGDVSPGVKQSESDTDHSRAL
jgi:hypothetical protein